MFIWPNSRRGDHDLPLSHSTVYRLLGVYKMQQKKTMCGLDNFAVNDLQLSKNEEKNMLPTYTFKLKLFEL
jgi:hypothetical protein